MSLAAGMRLGPYEIVSALGAGGMGEVYRARDSRLNRTVALKVLPQQSANDPEFRERFQREARAVSALEHPHICALYDVGYEHGVDFIVMPLLEGETLADRLMRGPLQVAAAVKNAVEIARALDQAHRHGIVHRDLKPGNIMLTKAGAVLLDFGLAKLRPSAADDLGNTSTQLQDVTSAGTILGTPQYMAPEQVRGHQADPRTDLFALGLVLHEMLSGRPAFRGASTIETLHAILHAEVPNLEGPDAGLPAMERVIRRCLEKDPDDRFQSASDLAFALEATLATSGSARAVAASPPPGARSRERVAWIVTAGLFVAVIGALTSGLVSWRTAGEREAVIRFAASIPDDVSFYSDAETHNLSLSPDGRQLAFIATAEGRRRLWVRRLDALGAEPLSETDGAEGLFWSPDSRSVAFFADGKLKRVEPSGGSVQTICDLPFAGDASGSWSSDNVIVFAEQFSDASRLYRVPATGGSPSTLVESAAAVYWAWVHFLPHSRSYLLHKASLEDPSVDGIYLRSLDSETETRVLATPMTRVEYGVGHLLYAREGSLLAQRFDLRTHQVQGEPVAVSSKLPFFDKTGWAEFSVSNTGALAYLTEIPMTRLTWVDRQGRESSPLTGPALHNEARLSPDGSRMALRLDDPQTTSGDLWVHDLARRTAARVVYGPADDSEPVWSPDGRRLAFFSCCEGASSLYIKDIDEAGKGKAFDQPGFQIPFDWSRDGQFILFAWGQPTTRRQLWLLPLDPARKPFPFVQTPFDDADGRFSPDGRWIAYTSNESGRREIHVRSFGRPQEKWQISSGGANEPRWRRDGKELFFLGADRRVMTVPITTGATFDYGSPAPLFRYNSTSANVFDVSADGQRFLIAVNAAGRELDPFAIVLNWTAELDRR